VRTREKAIRDANAAKKILTPSERVHPCNYINKTAPVENREKIVRFDGSVVTKILKMAQSDKQDCSERFVSFQSDKQESSFHSDIQGNVPHCGEQDTPLSDEPKRSLQSEKQDNVPHCDQQDNLLPSEQKSSLHSDKQESSRLHPEKQDSFTQTDRLDSSAQSCVQNSSLLNAVKMSSLKDTKEEV